MVLAYVSLIASVAVILNHADEKSTWVGWIQAGCLFAWLALAVYLFCYVIYFQSPHFGTDADGNGILRRLNLVETIYLLSQIITTIGYGDITPAYERGQVVVAIMVIFSILIIAGMVTEVVTLAQAR